MTRPTKSRESNTRRQPAPKVGPIDVGGASYALLLAVGGKWRRGVIENIEPRTGDPSRRGLYCEIAPELMGLWRDENLPRTYPNNRYRLAADTRGRRTLLEKVTSANPKERRGAIILRPDRRQRFHGGSCCSFQRGLL